MPDTDVIKLNIDALSETITRISNSSLWQQVIKISYTAFGRTNGQKWNNKPTSWNMSSRFWDSLNLRDLHKSTESNFFGFVLGNRQRVVVMEQSRISWLESKTRIWRTFKQPKRQERKVGCTANSDGVAFFLQKFSSQWESSIDTKWCPKFLTPTNFC